RVDLPTDDGGLVQCNLKAADERYSDGRVKFDTKLYNPARIIKIPGSAARKGDQTPQRPHRWSRVLEAPAELQGVPKALLEELAAECAKGRRTTVQISQRIPAIPNLPRSIPPEERARRYVFSSNFPDSVEGENGHGRLFHVACILVDGFGLSREEAMPIF